MSASLGVDSSDRARRGRASTLGDGHAASGTTSTSAAGARIGRSASSARRPTSRTTSSIGNFVKINAAVYICAEVTIEDFCMISAHTVFTNDRFPRAGNRESDGARDLASHRRNAGHAESGAESTIGANATIGPGVTLGEFSMVGMGSVVTRNVPPHALVVGNPARQVGWVCALRASARAVVERDERRTSSRQAASRARVRAIVRLEIGRAAVPMDAGMTSERVGIVGGGDARADARPPSRAGWAIRSSSSRPRPSSAGSPARTTTARFAGTASITASCRTIAHLIGLFGDLGLARRSRWNQTGTGYYARRAFLPDEQELDFVKFPLLSLVDKARLGATVVYATRFADPMKLYRDIAPRSGSPAGADAAATRSSGGRCSRRSSGPSTIRWRRCSSGRR